MGRMALLNLYKDAIQIYHSTECKTGCLEISLVSQLVYGEFFPLTKAKEDSAQKKFRIMLTGFMFNPTSCSGAMLWLYVLTNGHSKSNYSPLNSACVPSQFWPIEEALHGEIKSWGTVIIAIVTMGISVAAERN